MSRKYEGLVVLNTLGTEDGVSDLVSAEMLAGGRTTADKRDLSDLVYGIAS